MPASIRTLSQLPAITSEQLYNNSKLEVSIPVEVSLGQSNKATYKYASKSISAGALSEKISNDVRQGLIDENGLTKEIRVDDLCTMVSAIAYKNFTFDGVKNFVKDPIIDNSPLSGFPLSNDSLNKYSVNYETLKKFSNINSAPTIGPNFGFVTRLSGIQGNGSSELSRLLTIFKPKKIEGNDWAFSKEPYFVFNTNAKNIVPNEYVFKIEYGERESKPWKAPASGIFTCYGWLDEINNPAQSNESRWVALMGKESLLGESGWAILQVQPFIKNNYLSYVGFTFPVRKGMELKIVTGFAVGKNSDKYSGSNSSIANHVGNAFLGGVYTGLSAWNEKGENYATGDLSNQYITSSDISNIWVHEEECDLSVRDLIDKLSTDLSAAISAISGTGGSTIINNYQTSSYIDASKLSAGIDKGGQCGRQLNFGSDANYNGSKLTGVESYSYYYVGTEKTQSGTLYNGHFYKLISDTTTHTIDGKRYIKVNNKTYQLIDDPSGGENVFYTDDYFWYYTVCRDSFVNVIANPDFAGAPSTGIQCYLRYLNDKGEPYFKMLGSAVEYGGTSDNLVNVTLPLKRGSTLAFGAYVKRMTQKTNYQVINFSGKTYSTAQYKKTVTIKATSTDDTEHGDGKWPNSITIPVAPNATSIQSSTINSIYVNMNQTSGKCSIYARIITDSGTVIGAEKHMNAHNNKTADLVWTNLNLGTSKNIIVQISYGEPAQNTTTQVTIKKLQVHSTYTESPISDSVIGAPTPTFMNSKVTDLIDQWGKNGTGNGMLIQPHNHPSWLSKSSSRFMAAVSLMRLHP